MGLALAAAAKAAGHRGVLVCGPVDLEPPPCDVFTAVVSAEEMRRAVLKHASKADVVIMAAAVADYRPAKRAAGKIKKSREDLVLRLEPTPDILAELGRTKRPGQVLIGFALESQNARENALRKLREKNLDLIVVNGPAAIGADESSVELLYASGGTEEIDTAPKSVIARHIIAAADALARK
jgi:phosphopantothenoylcysteine decarboxylase/phosphopantothenate--cysteine ligase